MTEEQFRKLRGRLNGCLYRSDDRDRERQREGHGVMSAPDLNRLLREHVNAAVAKWIECTGEPGPGTQTRVTEEFLMIRFSTHRPERYQLTVPRRRWRP